MVCEKCKPGLRVHCPTGLELVVKVQDAFGAMTGFVARHGVSSSNLRNAYHEALSKYRLHVYGRVER